MLGTRIAAATPIKLNQKFSYPSPRGPAAKLIT